MSEVETSETVNIPDKWMRCNGRQLRKLFQAGLLWLEEHHQHVNALNVFPVPDGDTGTNMLLTMRNAFAQVEDSGETDAGRVAQALAHGALMGARGNSGVILSQIWRGMARGLHDVEVATADDIARAFREASDTAYKGVMRPVEGTILTIIREASEEAQDAVVKSADLRFLLERVVERSEQALARTPELLPVLKQAGVVDSGGKGLLLILEGMLRYATNQITLEPTQPAGGPAAVAQPAQARVAPTEGELEFPYDVQFILVGENLDVSTVRNQIDAMGDSTVVVGDQRTIKVHIHVKDPGEPLTYGSRLGRVTDVVVENMQMQMEGIIAPGAETAAPMEPTRPDEPIASVQPADAVKTVAPAEALAAGAPATGDVGIVAVAAGPGLAEIYRSLGAAAIVHGGQSNNPSIEELVEAVQQVPTDKVIILPNNKNIFLAAEAACDLCAKDVAVVPTRTAPEGISALLAFSPNGSLAGISNSMDAAREHVSSGEITVATRSVTLDGVEVEEGQIIGLVDGELRTAGATLDDILEETLAAMAIPERELLSLYYGDQVTEADAAAVGEQIELLYPDLEVEILPGGQPHYLYILGAE